MITTIIVMLLASALFPLVLIILIIYTIFNFISDVSRSNKEKKKWEEQLERRRIENEQIKISKQKELAERRKWEEIERNALKRNIELREQDEKDNYEQYNELTKW